VAKTTRYPKKVFNQETLMVSQKITRRRVIEGLSGIAACSLLGGPSFAAPAPASPDPSSPQPQPSGPLTSASVTVSSAPNGSIGPAFAGFSYEKSELSHPLFRPSNHNMIALFKLLGPSLLRVGGDSSDKMVWTPNGRGQKYPQVAPSDVAALAGFVQATGWKCLYTVNLGGSANGSTSPKTAADEVAYVAKVFGPSLYGIEIGNEPDSYNKPRRQYDGQDWSLQRYEALWNEYRSAILAKTPNVVITGPAAGHLADWTIPFTKDQTNAKISLLTDHYYANHNHTQPYFTPQVLISPDPQLIKNLEMMREASKVTGIPFRISETNSFTGDFRGTSDTYASTLWAIDYLFECAEGGAQGVNFHSAKTVGYTPIADDEDNVLEVRPEFYGILFFTMAGMGQLHQTKVSAGSHDVSAYTVKTSTGWSVVIVNKDQNQGLRATVQLPQNANSANMIVLAQGGEGSAPNLSATSGVTIQGATIGTNGSFSPGQPYTLPVKGAQIACPVPALAAVLIRAA
jgi:hypothetical protein